MNKLYSLVILCFSFTFSGFAQEIGNNDSLTTIIKDSRIDNLNKTYKNSYKLRGYRVQIYSGNKKQPANQARSTFLRLYREKKAHMDYEQPFIKLGLEILEQN